RWTKTVVSRVSWQRQLEYAREIQQRSAAAALGVTTRARQADTTQRAIDYTVNAAQRAWQQPATQQALSRVRTAGQQVGGSARIQRGLDRGRGIARHVSDSALGNAMARRLGHEPEAAVPPITATPPHQDQEPPERP